MNNPDNERLNQPAGEGSAQETVDAAEAASETVEESALAVSEAAKDAVKEAQEKAAAEAEEAKISSSAEKNAMAQSLWEDEIVGEKNWTDTAYKNVKKAEEDQELSFVKPFEGPYEMKRMETAERKIEADTSFDYVVPKQTFEQHMRHPERSTMHRGKTKTATAEEIQAAEEGFVFVKMGKKRGYSHHHHHHHHHHSSGHSSSGHSSSGNSDSSKISTADSSPSNSSSGHSSEHHHHHHHHHRHHRLKRWLRVLIIVVSVVLALAIAAVGTFYTLNEIGRSGMHDYNDLTIIAPTEETGESAVSVVDNGRTIVYNGKTYHFNEDIVCVACIGIANDIEERSVQSMGDSVNLVALDTKTGQMSVIGISRDTMTDINLYSKEGKYIDTEIMQLAYAYSFDNKSVTGGENTATALSRYFYGLPIRNYFAINMEAMTTINDLIGGVTLTSSLDFTSRIDGSVISAGDTVTLRGRDAELYVRSRDVSELDSNNSRMKRQQEYIKAFISQIIPMLKSDFSMVSKLYNIVSANSSTNLDLPKVTYLASTFMNKTPTIATVDFISINGKVTLGEEGYAEFHPDENSVLETMLDVFYTVVE